MDRRGQQRGKANGDTVVAEGGPAGTGGVLPGHLHERFGGSHEAAWVGGFSAPHVMNGIVDTRE